jgi:hypothetical protein
MFWKTNIWRSIYTTPRVCIYIPRYHFPIDRVIHGLLITKVISSFHITRARLVQLHERLHEQLHNFNSQTNSSLPGSLVSFYENSLSLTELSTRWSCKNIALPCSWSCLLKTALLVKLRCAEQGPSVSCARTTFHKRGKHFWFLATLSLVYVLLFFLASRAL